MAKIVYVTSITTEFQNPGGKGLEQFCLTWKLFQAVQAVSSR